MRLRKLVCLGGGLVSLGSPVLHASDADVPSKHLPHDTVKEIAVVRRGHHDNNGERSRRRCGEDLQNLHLIRRTRYGIQQIQYNQVLMLYGIFYVRYVVQNYT